MSYRLEQVNGQSSILCLQCGLRSFHPKDIEQAYCGACRIFHRPELELEQERSERLRRAFVRGELERMPRVFLGMPGVDEVERVLTGECELCGRFVACWMPLTMAFAPVAAGDLVYRCGQDCPGDAD